MVWNRPQSPPCPLQALVFPAWLRRASVFLTFTLESWKQPASRAGAQGDVKGITAFEELRETRGFPLCPLDLVPAV